MILELQNSRLSIDQYGDLITIAGPRQSGRTTYLCEKIKEYAAKGFGCIVFTSYSSSAIDIFDRLGGKNENVIYINEVQGLKGRYLPECVVFIDNLEYLNCSIGKVVSETLGLCKIYCTLEG